MRCYRALAVLCRLRIYFSNKTKGIYCKQLTGVVFSVFSEAMPQHCWVWTQGWLEVNSQVPDLNNVGTNERINMRCFMIKSIKPYPGLK